VDITIQPTRFKIIKGQDYWINSSTFLPYAITAKQHGKLELSFPAYNRCDLIIEPCKGPELLPKGSFEDVDGKLPSRWTAYHRSTSGAIMKYGHEFNPEQKKENRSNLEKHRDTAVISTDSACKSKKSLMLRKITPGTSLVVEKKLPLHLKPGRKYMLTGRYRLKNFKYGAGLHAFLLSHQAGKKWLSAYDMFLNPAIPTPPGVWRHTMVILDIPRDYTRANTFVRLEVRGATGTVFWDNLSLREAPSAAFPRLKATPDEELKPQITDKQLDESLKRMPVPTVEVRRVNQQPRLYVDNQVMPWFLYTPGPGNWPRGGVTVRMRKAGVKIQCLPLYTGYTRKATHRFRKQTWLGDGKYNFEPVKDLLRHAAKLAPDTKFVFYLWIAPYPGFSEKHPEAAWINHHGKKTIGTKGAYRETDKRRANEIFNFSYTAPVFRREVSKYLKALSAYLASIPEGKNLIGAHLVGGCDGQWFCQHYPDHYDRSEGSRQAFGQWLKKQYNNDIDKLRKAWKDTNLTFENVTIPKEKARYPKKYFLNPNHPVDRHVIDMNRFHCRGISDTLNQFAKSFKAGFGRQNRAIASVYYNDIMCGHLMNKWGLADLLNSDAIDNIVSVNGYGLYRLPGRTGGMNSVVASLRLHNKLYISEIDYRTDYSYLPPIYNIRTRYGLGRGDAEIAAQLRRDVGAALTRGEGNWLYGLGGPNWMNDQLMKNVSEAVRAAELSAGNPVKNDWGQVAVFLDERMQDYMSADKIFNARTSITSGLFARHALLKSGMPYDAYLLSDLDNPKRAKYKLNIFLSAPTITQKQIKWVQKNLQKDGNVLVFIHAAGWNFGGGFEKNIQALSGISVKCDQKRDVLYRYALKKFPDPLSKHLGFQQTTTSGPLFYVHDRTAKPLAVLESNKSKVIAAVKRHKNWTAIYLTPPGGIMPSFLRALAKNAGITPIGPEGDITHAGNGFISLHAVKSGKKTLHLRGKSNLYDLFNNKLVAKGVKEYSFELNTGETRWFRRAPVR
jgi:Beta-galactosidase